MDDSLEQMLVAKNDCGMRAVLVSAVLAQPFRNVPCLQVLGGSGYKADFFLFTEIVIQFVIVGWQGIREPVEP